MSSCTIDVKKLGRIPDGGGWWAHGRANVSHHRQPPVGYDYVHSAIDANSRVAYSEILDAETVDTCVPFLARAHAWFAALGITIERVLTDIQTRSRVSDPRLCRPAV